MKIELEYASIEYAAVEAKALREAIENYYSKMLKLPKCRLTSFCTQKYDLHLFPNGYSLNGSLSFSTCTDKLEPTKEQIAKIYEENFYNGD